MPLGLLSSGELGEVVEIRIAKPPTGTPVGDAGRSELRVEDLGIRVGRTVEMLSNSGSPILLKVDEARIALDRGLAMKIMIREAGR